MEAWLKKQNATSTWEITLELILSMNPPTMSKNLEEELSIPKTLIPGYGYFAACQDTEGNSFSLWQEDKKTTKS